ncbi:hypothetical protein C3747_25g239 [Trypanosoma cruzi]|uniref:Nucleotide exchange factor Fes1 domain-containing protein n=3 Tax=Trypanosoma cruzi TaxID=5693 RepID=Q4DAU4_TRYCC|nr:hypothetical protein, conserved [Trypanosoma cruzi]EAN89648.1 hypothetical protein, conserved [Trypanosoma cruzi]KAF8295872.1 hypothetical protein TcYC6_0087910 [Trypanosoma cruzi]PWV16158.1 hypothetical protein C3747_25g239 [Trypanosoma cruzi]RNC59119.1 hypothetical protein TcCL_ESM03187 [Trypanosoma cruzi]|eukprot:XP_811499.1 hypothetical protein [Trypanosoma cruzi strain CL Brener]
MSNDPSMNTALLNFCTSLSNGSGSGDREQLPRRNSEELQWLKEALASVEAPERQIKRLLETVARDGVTEDDCAAALEELSELVEDINWAVEFSLMNGHRIMLDLLRRGKLTAESEPVRQGAAMVIAHAAQLNERVQKCFEEAQWEEVLIPLLREEKAPAVFAALLHSCSCLCREYSPNALLFKKAGGIEVITRVLRSESLDGCDKKIIKRVLFLVGYLTEVLDIATEDMIRSVSVHAASSDEEIQMNVAQTLFLVAEKSCAIVRRVLKEVAPGCLVRWRNALLGEEDDPRRRLVNKLDREGHDG